MAATGAISTLAGGPIRVYADTSVFGGCFDPGFDAASTQFFQEVRAGRFALATSALVRTEIEPAPIAVRQLFDEFEPLALACDISDAAIDLQQAYLAAGIVSEKSDTDAMHVALATISACRVLVSWNFKHIVHIEKAPRYNAVNTLRGLPLVAIHTPAEVVRYEQGP